MAIEGISISLEQVLETARNIKSLNTQIVTRLNEIKREIKGKLFQIENVPMSHCPAQSR